MNPDEASRLRRNLSHPLPDQSSGVGRDHGWSSGDDLPVVGTATHDYDSMISQLLVKEAGAGDPVAAARRLATLEGIPLLDANRPEVESLAEALIVNGALPMKAFVDASHIAVCAVADIEILLTWNFKRIANGFMMKKIQNVCTKNGFDCP